MAYCRPRRFYLSNRLRRYLFVSPLSLLQVYVKPSILNQGIQTIGITLNMPVVDWFEV